MNDAETVFLCRHACAPALDTLVFLRIARSIQRDVVGAAALGEVGTQNFGPIPSTRPQFDHGHGGLDAEYGQFFGRMTGRIAGDEGGGAARVRDR